MKLYHCREILEVVNYNIDAAENSEIVNSEINEACSTVSLPKNLKILAAQK